MLYAHIASFVPETKGVALEDIDRLFGGTSHREAGEAMDQNHEKGHVGEFEENADKDIGGEKGNISSSPLQK